MTRFPDAEAEAVAFLNPIAGVPVGTRVPNPRPDSFVRVWRTGGTATRILDRPILTVQAWGKSENDTVAPSELAQKCRDAYLARNPQVEASGPYYDPDPTTGIARYTFNVQPNIRAN